MTPNGPHAASGRVPFVFVLGTWRQIPLPSFLRTRLCARKHRTPRSCCDLVHGGGFPISPFVRLAIDRPVVRLPPTAVSADLSVGAVILRVRIMVFVSTPASRALPCLQPLVHGDVRPGRLCRLVRGRRRSYPPQTTVEPCSRRRRLSLAVPWSPVRSCGPSYLRSDGFPKAQGYPHGAPPLPPWPRPRRHLLGYGDNDSPLLAAITWTFLCGVRQSALPLSFPPPSSAPPLPLRDR